MDVKVVSKVGQAFSRSLGSLSLADGSMLLRMRRASFALFALVGAVGLGLIVFIAQLGWPGVVSGPLPGPPTRAGTVDTAVALAESPATAGGAIGPAAVDNGRPARDSSQRGSGGTNNPGGQGSSQLSRAEKLAAAPGAQPGQGSNQPAAQPPASTPAAEPAPTTPTTSAPSTVVVESPPQSSSADQAKKASSNPRTSETAVAKAVSDSTGSTNSGAKSQGQKSATDRGTSSGSSKAGEAASAKAKRDESGAKAKAPPVAAAPAPSAAPAQSPAAAKEAADAAR